MKLTIRRRIIPMYPYTAFLLCDESGEPLPCQRGGTLRESMSAARTFTVEFVIDDGELRLIEGPPS